MCDCIKEVWTVCSVSRVPACRAPLCTQGLARFSSPITVKKVPLTFILFLLKINLLTTWITHHSSCEQLEIQTLLTSCVFFMNYYRGAYVWRGPTANRRDELTYSFFVCSGFSFVIMLRFAQNMFCINRNAHSINFPVLEHRSHSISQTIQS